MADVGSKNTTLTDDIGTLEKELGDLSETLRASVLNSPDVPPSSPQEAKPLSTNRFRELKERVEKATLLVKDMQVFIKNEIAIHL